MKNLILTLLVIVTCQVVAKDVFAQDAPDARTQDYIDYVIVLRDGLTERGAHRCSKKIEKLSFTEGLGRFNYLPKLGIVTTNLNSKAVMVVAQMSCVASVEEDVPAWPLPRVGREN